jgi:phage N-6-adenine-methyltransferase
MNNLSFWTDTHASSATSQWATPQAFFDRLDAEFKFSTDVCAEEWNAKCARYFTPEMDGLKQEWTGMCWMNPPYGEDIALWMSKAYRSATEGATVVCLVPARTDTLWWHKFATKGEVRFYMGRLKFVGKDGAGDSAPFPSALVVFHAYLDPGPCVKWVDASGNTVVVGLMS